jgi:hypothetical protein
MIMCLFIEIKDNVAGPSYFVGAATKKKIFVFVNATLQMTQAPCLLKNKIEIIFMFVVFTLHYA